MGLGNSTRSIYLGIFDGKITRRYQAAIPGLTKTRTTNKGKLLHEEHFDHLSGYITAIDIVPPKEQYKDFGDSLVIRMVDGDESFTLQIQRSSGYAVAFFKVMMNIDFSKRTTIIPSMKMEDQKKKTTIFVTQQGISGALKHFFTKDDPKGMPQLVKVHFKGEDRYDDTDMQRFFEKVLNEKIKPRISTAASNLKHQPNDKPADNVTEPATTAAAKDNINSSWDDDLPF